MEIGDLFDEQSVPPMSGPPQPCIVDPIPSSSSTSITNDSSETEKKKDGKVGKDNTGTPRQSCISTPPPNVDELLASLEATVNGTTHQSAPEGHPQPPPPLPPTPSAASVPTPPVSQQENVPHDSSPAPKPSSDKTKNKRKPRNTRQQKVKQQQQNQQQQQSSSKDQPKGSSRTEGTGRSRKLPSSSSENISPPSASDSSASGRQPPHLRQPTPPSTSFRSPFQSHNRTWSLGGSSGSSSTSAYSVKPGSSLSSSTHPESNDITSFRFLPDTEEKADLVLQTILGENEGKEKRVAPSLVLHTLPAVRSVDVTGIDPSQAPGARPVGDEEQFITLVDFTSKYPPETQVFHTIPRKKNIVFLLLFRPLATRKRWLIPSSETAADFISDTLSTLYQGDYPYAKAYERSGRWGLFPTLLLSADDMVAADGFRRHLSCTTFQGMDYDTFPKEVATQTPDISILLRNNMKLFAHEIIPKVLFARNQERLAGTLRVLSTRHFPAGEKSHKGELKDNWRQIDLKGDDQVMRCLRFIPESSPFKLGVEMVQIKGGLRPQEPEVSRMLGKRTWSATTSSSSSPATEFPPPSILAPLPGPQPDTPLRGGKAKRGRGGRRTPAMKKQ